MALNSDRYTRREAMKLAGLLGFGAGLPEQVEGRTAQVNRVSSSVPGIPSWPTEIRRLAPDVYAYTQAGGPGIDNASLSNAGVLAGPEGLRASTRAVHRFTPRLSNRLPRWQLQESSTES